MAEVVVVLPHWGVEYTETPTDEQRQWAAQIMAAGATLVVGNHPHLIQPVEEFPNGLVAYALGNFVFDQESWRTRQGVVLEAEFRGAQWVSWRLRPVHIYDMHQPQWAVGAEAQEILQRAQAPLTAP
jgi:poly-gamma-glutamate synthesis protein (capsule biosynthesis protein)